MRRRSEIALSAGRPRSITSVDRAMRMPRTASSDRLEVLKLLASYRDTQLLSPCLWPPGCDREPAVRSFDRRFSGSIQPGRRHRCSKRCSRPRSTAGGEVGHQGPKWPAVSDQPGVDGPARSKAGLPWVRGAVIVPCLAAAPVAIRARCPIGASGGVPLREHAEPVGIDIAAQPPRSRAPGWTVTPARSYDRLHRSRSEQASSNPSCFPAPEKACVSQPPENPLWRAAGSALPCLRDLLLRRRGVPKPHPVHRGGGRRREGLPHRPSSRSRS